MEQETQTAAEPVQEQPQAVDPEKKGLQEALVAERRKRQEIESRTRTLEEKLYQLENSKAPQDEEVDDYTKELIGKTKNEIRAELKAQSEQEFLNRNPHLVEVNPVSGKTWLEEKLEPILRKRPYLSHAITTASNRYERCLELINDYAPPDTENDNRKRFEENATKPGNPASLAKSTTISKLDQIKNMSRREFSEYRAKLRGRAPNIR